MNKTVHVLNGDALLEQFPEEIKGEILVARECLIDGNICGDTLDEFFENRARFIEENFGDSKEYYSKKVKSQFSAIRQLRNAEINLWFEDDLFCQVNFWFTMSLIDKSNMVYLIRPETHNAYGFGGLDQEELISALGNKTLINTPSKVANLWECYQANNLIALQKQADELATDFPFIAEAVKANIERIPSENDPGRPIRSLLKIMKDLDTDDFGPVFREFCVRESIYGFGDMQVLKLYDQIMRDRNV
ncbi:DUF1835 domain-containing protein [Jiulongibacter sp. NS-SX5]|uniref:DUF1835 domain-containing protein n=1 Tax=Jiulongibacter sp. NS-SX5 TaxID=3463854 RepID=UPI0040588B0F